MWLEFQYNQRVLTLKAEDKELLHTLQSDFNTAYNVYNFLLRIRSCRQLLFQNFVVYGVRTNENKFLVHKS